MSDRAKSRRRGEELVQAIHQAAIAELNEVGIGRLTMEGIARRAETAKTSLYRRWPGTDELLIDAFFHTMPQETPRPAADNLRQDLIDALVLLRDWMMTPVARAQAAIVSERDRHPKLVEAMFSQVYDARGSRFTYTVLRHYAANGKIDPAKVTPVVTDIGEALVFKSTYDNDAPVPDATLAAIVDQAILPALGVTGPVASS